MDDFRLVAGFHHHDKLIELDAELGIAGCWSWVCLLSHVAQFRPDGSVTSAAWAARAAQWRDTPDVFVETLVRLRLLDRDASGALTVHDWFEHNPFAIGAQERKAHARAAAVEKWNRYRASAQKAENGHRASAQTDKDDDRASAQTPENGTTSNAQTPAQTRSRAYGPSDPSSSDPSSSDPDKSKERRKSPRNKSGAEQPQAAESEPPVDEHGRPIETPEQRAAALALLKPFTIGGPIGEKLNGTSGKTDHAAAAPGPASPEQPPLTPEQQAQLTEAQQIIERKRRERELAKGGNP